MSPLPPLLVLLLSSLLLPALSIEWDYERKTIGREDVDNLPPLGPFDCARGPGWTGRLKYTLDNPGFQDAMSTYKLWWKESVKRSNCVETTALLVNGKEPRNRVIERDHVIFQFKKPKCERTSFILKFYIYFKGPLGENKCFEIESGQFYPETAKLENFFKTNKIPSATPTNALVKIYWRRQMFEINRFTNCLTKIAMATKDVDTKTDVPNSFMNTYNQYMTVDGKCQAQHVTLTYTFTQIFPTHTVHMTIPAFPSMCGKRPVIQTNQNITGNAINNFFVKNDYMVTKIFAGSFGCVLLLVLIPTVTIMLVKKKRKRRETKMEERKDHNPIYGTYYDGPTYITATDNNELYGS